MDEISWFNDFTLVIVTLIALFVSGVAGYLHHQVSGLRPTPTPSRVTHHTMLEVAWTVIPIFILVIIAVPSFKLLYAQYDPSKIYEDFDPQTTKFLTVKAIGQSVVLGL